MRTTIDLPQTLIEEALKVSHKKTKTALIITALENLILKNKLEELQKYKGKVNLPINMSELRDRK
jgi:hypothetical protein